MTNNYNKEQRTKSKEQIYGSPFEVKAFFDICGPMENKVLQRSETMDVVKVSGVIEGICFPNEC